MIYSLTLFVWLVFGVCGSNEIVQRLDGGISNGRQLLQSYVGCGCPPDSYLPGSGWSSQLYLRGDRLHHDEKLFIGDALMSKSREFYAVMQEDGNFVLYNNEGVIQWASNTAGSGGQYLIFQTDDHPVIYDSNGVALWGSLAYDPSNPEDNKSLFVLEDTGRLVVLDANGGSLWQSINLGSLCPGGKAWGTPQCSPPDSFFPGAGWSNPLNIKGDRLHHDEKIQIGEALKSENGEFYAVMQEDGNFVVYDYSGTAKWHAGIDGSGAQFLIFQEDDHPVIYDSNMTPLWASGVYDTTDTLDYLSEFVLENNGQLVVYNGYGKAIWQINF